MKVEDLLLTQYTENQAKSKAGRTDGQEFAKTLAQAVGSASSSSTVSGTSATASLMEASTLGRIMATGTKGAEPVEQIEKALGLLDQFSTALADPLQTLKQVAPLADDLEAESVKLGRLSQELPGDSGLKALLNETAVLAGVEAAKFKRGDYVQLLSNCAMNVNQVADIYTNLGRLGRDVLKRDQPPEGTASQGQTEDNSPVLIPVEPRAQLSRTGDQTQALDLDQARQLTATIEGQILETAQRPWSLGFLRVEQVSIITPRYV